MHQVVFDNVAEYFTGYLKLLVFIFVFFSSSSVILPTTICKFDLKKKLYIIFHVRSFYIGLCSILPPLIYLNKQCVWNNMDTQNVHLHGCEVFFGQSINMQTFRFCFGHTVA